MTSYLLISHLRIHNANALSSTMTIGTPAMTAFLGFSHALQRKLPKQWALHFKKVGICIHKLHVHQYREASHDAFSLIGVSHPLNNKGERPSFVEEARCDLDFSLIIQCDSMLPEEGKSVIAETIQTMKFAGGDIKNFGQLLELIDSGENAIEKRLKRELMPGYWLIDRSDLIRAAVNENIDAMQALLNYLSVFVSMQKNATGVSNKYSKQESGWLVPIVVGFQGLTNCELAENQRDPSKLHRFAEPVITLGEYKMVHRLQSVSEILWSYHFDPETNLYLCQMIKQ